MNTLKLDKRTSERTDSIRRRLDRLELPAGERRAILGHLDKIDYIARKASKQLSVAHHRGPVVHAPYDARTEDDMAGLAKAKKAIFDAMMKGRRVDCTMSREFEISQVHTAIHQIRRDIDRKNLDIVLCDEWKRPEGRRPYKQYWIVQKEAPKC